MSHEVYISALRRYGASHRALMQGFARHLSVNDTDATALTEIFFAEDRGHPLSASTLATALGRSRPAVSALLARLEAARLISRRAHPADGRRETLHAGEAVQAAVIGYFTPLSERMTALLAPLSADSLTESAALLDAASAVIEAVLEEN